MKTSSSAPTVRFPVGDRPWLHRFARRSARGARSEFPAGELESLADLAALRAWRRYDAGTGFAFTTYARWAVLGAVRRAVAKRRVRPPRDFVPQLPPAPSAFAVLLTKLALDALDEVDRLLLVRHLVAEESIDALARELDVSKTSLWRRLTEAKARARAAIDANELHPGRPRPGRG